MDTRFLLLQNYSRMQAPGGNFTRYHGTGGRSNYEEASEDENFIPENTVLVFRSWQMLNQTPMVPNNPHCQHRVSAWQMWSSERWKTGEHRGSHGAFWVQEQQDQQEDHHCQLWTTLICLPCGHLTHQPVPSAPHPRPTRSQDSRSPAVTEVLWVPHFLHYPPGLAGLQS